MSLTPDQVTALAPDAASAAAGRKLSSPRDWKLLGRSATAIWGECQGSALYQVRVDLSSLSVKCSCPSRKFPCKHGLGLLLIFAGNPTALAESAEPEWVSEWLARRAESEAKKEARREAKEEGRAAPVDEAAQARRAEKRQARVEDGAAGLSLWLSDLLRRGLSGLDAEGPTFWEAQAARLVDAQATGLAARVRALGEIPGSSRDWPEPLAAEIGRLGLVLHAFSRLGALSPGLQADVRQMLGFQLPLEEVAAGPDNVSERWVVLGQWVEDTDRIRTQRSWLRGASGRDALVLQFSAGKAAFPEALAPGSAFDATLAFWPGAFPQRALVKERRGVAEAATALPGPSRVEGLLASVAKALSRQPFLERFPVVLDRVVPCPGPDGLLVADESGDALPLVAGSHHLLLALSGGEPACLTGEWHRDRLRPLGFFGGGRFVPLAGEGS